MVSFDVRRPLLMLMDLFWHTSVHPWPDHRDRILLVLFPGLFWYIQVSFDVHQSLLTCLGLFCHASRNSGRNHRDRRTLVKATHTITHTATKWQKNKKETVVFHHGRLCKLQVVGPYETYSICCLTHIPYVVSHTFRMLSHTCSICCLTHIP